MEYSLICTRINNGIARYGTPMLNEVPGVEYLARTVLFLVGTAEWKE